MTQNHPCLGRFPAFLLAAAVAVALVLPAAESLSAFPSRTQSPTPRHEGIREGVPEGILVRKASCQASCQNNDDSHNIQQQQRFSKAPPIHNPSSTEVHNPSVANLVVSRNTAIQTMLTIIAAAAVSTTPLTARAYTPDPDKLQESLYFISRVQEATVQQERFMNKLGGTQQLRAKLQLTLRLVDKNYKLLDQINYSSAFVTPADKLVEASEAGYEAVDALQAAIEFVKKEDNWKTNTGDDDNADAAASKERIAVLTECMQTCRSQLLVYTEFMPTEKLQNARLRVETENIQNRDEFDGDEDAGVYNPVNLPWKPVLKATEAYKKPKGSK